MAQLLWWFWHNKWQQWCRDMREEWYFRFNYYKWVREIYHFDHLNWDLLNPHKPIYCKGDGKGIWKTNHIADSFSMKYMHIQQALLDSSGSFTACVQRLWKILYHDDNGVANYDHKDDVITGKLFRITGPLCGGIRRSPVDFLTKGQWCVMFSIFS